VRGFRQPVLRVLVALLGLLDLLLELDEQLAALVRDLAEILGILFLFLELALESRDLSADLVALALELRAALLESESRAAASSARESELASEPSS